MGQLVNRRSFLSGLAALIGAQALEQIPGNRVWSFPSKIVIKRSEADEALAQAFVGGRWTKRPELELIAQMNYDLEAAWENVAISSSEFPLSVTEHWGIARRISPNTITFKDPVPSWVKPGDLISFQV